MQRTCLTSWRLVALTGVMLPAVTAHAQQESPAQLARAASARLDALEDTYGPARRKEELESARSLVQKLQETAPAYPGLIGLVGRLQSVAGQGKEAADSLVAYVETPDGRLDWKALRALSRLFRESYPQLSKSYATRALQLRPREPSLQYLVSYAALQLGDLTLATRAAQTACAGDDPEVLHLVHLSRIYQQAGRWDEAEEASRRAVDRAAGKVERNPGNVTHLKALVGACDHRIQVLFLRTQAQTAEPGDFLALARVIGRRSVAKSRIDVHEALRHLEAGVGQFDAPPEALLEAYATHLAKAGRTGEADTAFARLLEAFPDNAAAKDWAARRDAAP